MYDSTYIYGSYRKLAALGDACLIVIIEQDMLRKPQILPSIVRPVQDEDGIWQIDGYYCTEEVKTAYLDYLKVPTNRTTAHANQPRAKN